MSLLDSHGIGAFRVSGNPQAIWPMAVTSARANPGGRGRAGGGRGPAGHRQPPRGARPARGAPARRSRGAGADASATSSTSRRLLEQALTHRSRAAEDTSRGGADNESLEFLGDALLGFVVADWLFQQYPRLRRGAEVEDQGHGRVHAVAGAPRGDDAAGRLPDPRDAARRRPAAAASRRSWPTRSRRCWRRSTWTAAWSRRPRSCATS